jgi:hypothetical protein
MVIVNSFSTNDFCKFVARPGVVDASTPIGTRSRNYGEVSYGVRLTSLSKGVGFMQANRRSFLRRVLKVSAVAAAAAVVVTAAPKSTEAANLRCRVKSLFSRRRNNCNTCE